MARFTLVPADVPVKATVKGSLYDEVLAQFEESGLKSVRVDIPDAKPASIVVGLRKRIDICHSSATVAQRGTQVFLVKEELR